MEKVVCSLLKVCGDDGRVFFKKKKTLQVETYRFKRKLLLYRFDVIFSSGKTIRLIQDVPDKEALYSLAKKAGSLLKKPLKVDH